MKKIVVVFIYLLVTSGILLAQIDCSSYLKYYKAEPPYKISSLSSSDVAVSGDHIKYEVTVTPNKEYRFFFFASGSFNNRLHFKIMDYKTKEVYLDVPGENPETNNAKGTAALVPYRDPYTNKDYYPYFDIKPLTATTLYVYIDVAEPEEHTDEYGNVIKDDPVMGCVAILILEKTIRPQKNNQQSQ